MRAITVIQGANGSWSSLNDSVAFCWAACAIYICSPSIVPWVFIIWLIELTLRVCLNPLSIESVIDAAVFRAAQILEPRMWVCITWQLLMYRGLNYPQWQQSLQTLYTRKFKTERKTPTAILCHSQRFEVSQHCVSTLDPLTWRKYLFNYQFFTLGRF